MSIEKPSFPEIKKDPFANKKEKVLHFLEKEQTGRVKGGMGENAGQLDDNIREFVNKINQLPFLRTRQSCAGGLRSREDIIAAHPGEDEKSLYLPDEGKVFYNPGWIDFFIKDNEKGRLFIEKLGELSNQFDGSLSAKFDEEDIDPEGEFCMLGLGENAFGGSLNTDPEKAKESGVKRDEFKIAIMQLIKEFLEDNHE